MIGEKDGTLLRIAQLIADGSPVDWAAESTARPDMRGALEGLRNVESVVRTHDQSRGTQPAASADKSSTSPFFASATPSLGAEPWGAASRTEPCGTWGRLQLLERIGGGEFGEVFRAHDPSLSIDVALKLWRLEGSLVAEVEEFLAEARRLARIRHKNVLLVYGVDQPAGRPGMWTELVRGQTLEQYLERQGPLSAHEAALIGMDLCGALAALHSAGLIHRDLKASNVMREQGGRVVLMDFGSVRETPRGGLERSSTIKGTPISMAPEQIMGGAVSPATDVFGLGVLLYHLVSGHYPIEADNLYLLVEKHRSGERVPLRDRRADLPAEFVQVVEKAIESDPGLRYPSAGAMERALAAIVARISEPVTRSLWETGTLAQASPPPVPEPQASKPRRNLMTRLALTGAVLLAATLAGVLLSSRNETARNRSATGSDAAGEETNGPSSSGTRAVEETVAESADRPPSGSPSAGQTPVGDPPSSPPVSMKTTLFRVTPGGDERLLPGARIQPGDDLFLELECSVPLHVYVLNEDEAGEAFLLFPADFDSKNPLPPGKLHRLPGTRAGRPVQWQVSSAGGKEAVIVVASRQPLRQLEADIAALPAASEDRPVYKEVSESTKLALRGIGRVSDGRPQATHAAGRLSEMLRTVPHGVASSDPWIWTIELENPRR